MSSKSLKLSVLDLASVYSNDSPIQTLKYTTELIKLADRLGFTRYWFAEHHNTDTQLSTSPDILTAHAAAITKNIRIGTGGVMLPNHSPLKVVENFSILEALHPDRIDLGMGRAPGTDALTQMALRNSSESLDGNDVMQRLYDVLRFFDHDFPEDHPYHKITPSADKALRPELFMLGSSDGGMQIASQLGLGFAFAGQINPDWAAPMLRKYREQFKPSQYRSEPYSILSVIVVCGETEEDANYYAGPAVLQWVRWGTGQFSNPPPTSDEAASHKYTAEESLVREQNKGKFVIGDQDSVKQQLTKLAEETEVDEIMIVNMGINKQAQQKSLQSIAEAFELS